MKSLRQIAEHFAVIEVLFTSRLSAEARQLLDLSKADNPPQQITPSSEARRPAPFIAPRVFLALKDHAPTGASQWRSQHTVPAVPPIAQCEGKAAKSVSGADSRQTEARGGEL
jgi:hypothetical protein